MESYLMMLYVTFEQETALKSFFLEHGWSFCKPDLSVTTDKVGPASGPSVAVPSQLVAVVSTEDHSTLDSSREESDQTKTGKRKSKQGKGPAEKVAKLWVEAGSSLEDSTAGPTIIAVTSGSQAETLTTATMDKEEPTVAVKEETVYSDYDQGNDEAYENESTDTEDGYENTTGEVDGQEVEEGEVQLNLDSSMTVKPREVKVRTPRRMKYKSYSYSAVVDAYRAVKEQNMPLRRASRLFKVPQTTLCDRVSGRISIETTHAGQSSLFSLAEESALVDHLKNMATYGYAYTIQEILEVATNYAVFLGKRSKEQKLTDSWFQPFRKRWPDLKNLKQKNVVKKREEISLEAVLTEYLQELEIVLKKNSLLTKPELIFVLDEIGIQTKDPQLAVTDENGANVSDNIITTLIACGNAAGRSLPPYFIFTGAKMNQDLLKESSPGSSGTVSESGLSDAYTFCRYLEEHFLRHVQRQNKEEPVLLLLDGYKSHVNIPAIKFAQDNNIILHMLPANTSKYVSPLEGGCFEILQQKYISECHKFLKATPKSVITKLNVARLVSVAYKFAMSSAALKKQFEVKGIFPLQPKKVKSSS